jgi:uncharacterized cysteine cluster protein YcgN (CxxCxxCC family)
MASPLLELTPQQWEDLCDGCGRCCLVKLEDEDSGALYYTNVACRYLDTRTCRCGDYANRARVQPRCMVLGPDRLDVLELMPWTCAYRLVHEEREIGQNAKALSVAGRVVSEAYIHEDQLEDHVITWVGNTAPGSEV